MELNYEQDMYIDESALDVEWLGQPSLMLKYTQEEARVRRELDRVKEKVTVVRAELDRQIRTYPDDFNLPEKITEKMVEAAIVINDKFKEVTAELIDAQYEVQMLRGAVQAVDQRKQALEHMSKLLGLQYFAGPRTPRDLPYEIRQDQQKRRANSTVQIKRRKK